MEASARSCGDSTRRLLKDAFLPRGSAKLSRAREAEAGRKKQRALPAAGPASSACDLAFGSGQSCPPRSPARRARRTIPGGWELAGAQEAANRVATGGLSNFFSFFFPLTPEKDFSLKTTSSLLSSL